MGEHFGDHQWVENQMRLLLQEASREPTNRVPKATTADIQTQEVEVQDTQPEVNIQQTQKRHHRRSPLFGQFWNASLPQDTQTQEEILAMAIQRSKEEYGEQERRSTTQTKRDVLATGFGVLVTGAVC